ncbi:MAG: hypothetical protein AB8E15_11750 [Bdellovibrionales bacterium]
MSIISFLFGKKPEITFNKEGNTSHKLGDKKWDAWKDRFRQNPDYNWRNHSGKNGKSK